jgi:adenylate kinase
MRLVFVGVPGAGKGTQAVKIADELNIPHISTGDIFRAEVGNSTPIGLEAKKYMDKGELVPDNIVIDMVCNRLLNKDCKQGFLLDGFPRTEIQAKEFDKKLNELGLELDYVIYFTLKDEEVIDRLTGRRMCSSCGENYHIKGKPCLVEGICDKCGGEIIQREDDKVDTIKNRLEVFKKQTATLIDYYKNQNLLIQLAANKSIDEVYNSLLSRIGVL